jgi:hypothetical protein
MIHPADVDAPAGVDPVACQLTYGWRPFGVCGSCQSQDPSMRPGQPMASAARLVGAKQQRKAIIAN